ncbi:MAG: hypothetical protein H6873_13075 [Hyphomicrobiaceae bacterium]|nr:hypothetical protein [Hyphomicrobiaceae bacterium]
MSSNATAQGEFLVNTFTTNDQITPVVATLADGGWVVAWASDLQDGSGYGVYFQHYNKNGATVGNETIVNSTTTGSQLSPAIAALADGGFVIAWADSAADTDGYGIFQQRFDKTGALVGSETQVNTYTTLGQSEPAITALSGGGWVTSWESASQDTSSYGIYQQKFDANGNPSGSETPVNTTTLSGQENPDSAGLIDGGWVDVWMSYAQDGSFYGVYMQRYAANGVAVGNETQVNTTTNDKQQDPSVAALADGGFVVVWDSNLQDGDLYGVYMQRYDRDGHPVGGETQVNSYTTGAQYASDVTSLADGGWVVSWTGLSFDGGFDVVVQRYDAHGNEIGGETRVNATPLSTVTRPQIEARADGGWVVTWASDDGSSTGIYQRVFVADIEGTANKDVLNGTHFSESIFGFGGNDVLDGKGGGDILVGGFGNDTYIIRSADDDVQEGGSAQGRDLIKSMISFDMTSDVFVENLTLLGTANINGTGNAINNRIVGNKGANTLDGQQGNDVLKGGGKADTFVFKTGWDHDTVLDFHALGPTHDVIDLQGLASVTGFKDLTKHHMTQVGNNVVIDGLGGDVLTLKNVQIGNLTAADFHF